MTIEQRLDNIDARLERLVQVSEEQRQSIEALVAGLGKVSEDTTQQRLSMEQQRQSIEALVAGLGKVSEDTTVLRLDWTELKEITLRQAETTDRLIRIVERLTGDG
jgi:methyl-accepting chemotaxis protein